MNNDLFKQLTDSNLPVCDMNDTFLTNAFVISFKANKEGKETRPFLLINLNELKSNNELKIFCSVVEDGIRKVSYIRIDVDSSKEFILKELNILAFPMAGFFDSLGENKNVAGFKNIPEDLFIKDQMWSKVSSLESVYFFTYVPGLKRALCLKRNVASILSKDEDTFYFEKGENLISTGFPVILYSESSYVENNRIQIGSRFCILGYAKTIDNGFVECISGDKLIKSIKQKFDFDTKFE